jgi:hypothetical protein
MGGTSTSSQTQSSSLAPYSPASTGMNGILGSLSGMAPSAGTLSPTESGAINQVISNSNGTPNYSAPINTGTLGLLNGGGANNNNGAISSNLGTLNSELGATASGANIGANSALTPELNAINTGVTNQVNSQFAAAGRQDSPANLMALGMGIAQGDAPVIANQYNQDVSNQMNAANDLYGAGNTTYGILNANQANANTNFENGVGAVSGGLNAENAAPTAAINAATQQFNIPASQLQTLLGSISPVAAQFGTQSAQSNGSQTMSGIQQAAMLMQGIGSMIPKGNITFGS